MTLSEIKTDVDNGRVVYWSNSSYRVIRDRLNQYLILHTSGACIGLTHQDGTTLNGREKEFFVKDELGISSVSRV